ncbi:MAG: stress response translation initiation inhibitor YciH [Candidatus Diapherotrites archaeon]|nr:stress response translation initiation inhibitor YciH [Candidatus Diapherotrites archaeon]
MAEFCSVCGQPKELCVCGEIAKEAQKIRVRTLQRRFGKHVTTVSGLDKDINLDELNKEFKKKLACGGTVKNGIIELQGAHKEKVKEILLKQGFKEELIDA